MSSTEIRDRSSESDDVDRRHRRKEKNYRRPHRSERPDRKFRSQSSRRNSDRCHRRERRMKTRQNQRRFRSRSHKRCRSSDRTNCRNKNRYRSRSREYHRRSKSRCDRSERSIRNSRSKEVYHQRFDSYDTSEVHQEQHHDTEPSSSESSSYIDARGEDRHHHRNSNRNRNRRRRRRRYFERTKRKVRQTDTTSEFETSSDSTDDRSRARLHATRNKATGPALQLRNVNSQIPTISYCNRMTQTEDNINFNSDRQNERWLYPNLKSVRENAYAGNEYSQTPHNFEDLQSSHRYVETDHARKAFVCKVNLQRGLPVSTAQSRIKNNNPEWHCSTTVKDCKICKIRFSIDHWGSLVKHYVNVHPSYEVFPSRVAPDVADLLRDTAAAHECRKFKKNSHYFYKQLCYFCNRIKSLEKYKWIDHLVNHTGYYQNRYSVNFQRINVVAFLCDLCNYVRFDRIGMEIHLRNEHGVDHNENFKEVIFLRFPATEHNRTFARNSNGSLTPTVMQPGIKLQDAFPPIKIKNNNPDWHWLSQDKICKICGYNSKSSLTSHYVNEHPNFEVIPSRVAPIVADKLRSQKYAPKCEIFDTHGCSRRYKQICHFCNESKCLVQRDWVEHLISHTGYFTKQCSDCFKKLRRNTHNCNGKRGGTNVKRIPQPQFNGKVMIAFLCDLCNFVRFNVGEMENHLRNEHEGSNGDRDGFEQIIFSTFPDHDGSSRVDYQSPALMEDTHFGNELHSMTMANEDAFTFSASTIDHN